MKRTNESTIEAAVLKQAERLEPYSIRQVVLALTADYAYFLEFDEVTEELEPESVLRALKKLAQNEPYLFKSPGALNDNGSGEDEAQGRSAANKALTTKQETLVSEALSILGIKK